MVSPIQTKRNFALVGLKPGKIARVVRKKTGSPTNSPNRDAPRRLDPSGISRPNTTPPTAPDPKYSNMSSNGPRW
jgi:hypothetical protein